MYNKSTSVVGGMQQEIHPGDMKQVQVNAEPFQEDTSALVIANKMLSGIFMTPLVPFWLFMVGNRQNSPCPL